MRSRLSILVATLVCTASPTTAYAETLSAVTYGACSNERAAQGLCTLTTSTNRVAFAAAIAASSPGDVIRVPNGTYVFDVASLRSIHLNKAITLEGESRNGVVLTMDSSLIPPNTSWRTVEITSSNVTIRRLTLSGNKPNPGTTTAYDPLVEHHAGIFIGNTSSVITDFTLEDATLTDYQGDCLQIYAQVHRPLIQDDLFQYCQRSGMSFTPPDGNYPVLNAIVRRTTFTGITAQPIDNEHGPVYGADISYNTFNSSTNNYSLTMSGYAVRVAEEVASFNNRSRGWHVHHNTFQGGIFVIRAGRAEQPEDVSIFEHNTTVNVTTKPCFEVSRSTTNVIYRNNNCTMARTDMAMVAVHINGTGAEQYCETAQGVSIRCDLPGAIVIETWQAYPSLITISDNTIRVLSPIASTLGIRAQSSDSVSLERNSVIGPDAPHSSSVGILLRATIVARDFGSAYVRDNLIRNWGTNGISVAGNTTARMNYAEITGNSCENVGGATAMTRCVSLDDGTGALRSVVIKANSRGCGVSRTVVNAPAGATILASPLEISVACP